MFENDICMCEGKECPMKLNCVRYLVEPEERWQPYFKEVPFDKEKDNCVYFMDKNKVGQFFILRSEDNKDLK